MMRARALFVLCLLALSSAWPPNPAHAAGEITTPAVSSNPGALPALPRLAPITSAEPSASALQDVDRLLERLTSADARTRTSARSAIQEATPAWIPAIRVRVQDIRSSLDRVKAPRILEDARKAGRKSMRAAGKAADSPAKGKSAPKEADDAGEGDWLDFLLDQAKPKDKPWSDLVRLLSMERMLAAIGTTPAVREMIAFHAYFGDMLRIDLQRQIAKLRDRAVPSLIEARQHDAKIVQRWASRQLDLLGKAIPGEAVATDDTQILADVLRAYGRTRDVDAVRVILSFCNSDRIQLREAAREAIAAIGEPGIWQLRDAYLNLTGNKAPRDFTWDRIARELFGMYDRARMAEVYKLMDQGVAAAAAGKLEEATNAFDKVLARSPLFERRKEMVAPYVGRAQQMAKDRREEALAMLRKALRLDPKGDAARKIEAEIAYQEGVVLLERGTPDKFPFARALELDASHEGARAALRSLQDAAAPRKSLLHRYVAAAGVGLMALIAMIFLARRREPASEPEEKPGPGPVTPP
jgi:tetratricopeptide (TPR) repeat protein